MSIFPLLFSRSLIHFHTLCLSLPPASMRSLKLCLIASHHSQRHSALSACLHHTHTRGCVCVCVCKRIGPQPCWILFDNDLMDDLCTYLPYASSYVSIWLLFASIFLVDLLTLAPFFLSCWMSAVHDDLLDLRIRFICLSLLWMSAFHVTYYMDINNPQKELSFQSPAVFQGQVASIFSICAVASF